MFSLFMKSLTHVNIVTLVSDSIKLKLYVEQGQEIIDKFN